MKIAKKITTWIKKKVLLLFGRCPYCGKKFVNGTGGSGLFILNGLKVCPDKHYAEELVIFAGGATLIHDQGGKPLDIKGLDEDDSL